jgi:asparagine synthase (glutamine-hydrolysing)
MCGLILAPASYPETKIQNALTLMNYRGPDSQVVAKFGNWNLGHVRLAIQDETGVQPFRSGKDSLAMFVGEFFTHGGIGEQQYVRQLLGGASSFHDADGFWTLVETNGEIAMVFTDHLGIKPTYYWPQYGIVCSEIGPMFALEQRPEFDRTYLSNCIKFGYDYSGRTPYKGIVQLPPGHKLVLGHGVRHMEEYFKWHLVDSGPQSIREIIEEAISNRLISDRPVAMLLSGGLDSSIIYYTLKNMGRQVKAFSVENGETEYLPEGVTPLSVPDVTVEDAVTILQAPLDLGSMVPQVQLARAVADEGYRVCLTGDGADEVFGGYRRAKEYDSQRSDTFCELPYYHMPRLDRVMMASTVELRSPFLAPKVVAAGLRLPWGYRTNKEALKHAFTNVVPHEIIWRKKHPLKTAAVIGGGTDYRRQLVRTFCSIFNPEETPL